MSGDMEFNSSDALTLGVELELQLVDPRSCDLTRAASDLLHVVSRHEHPGEVKPEITESMVEISTSIQRRYAPLVAELAGLREAVEVAAGKLNVLVSGGGAHPFQHWTERQVFDQPRFKLLSDLYGYLAKQFTIFGQHIHIGCTTGDEAMLLLHAMSRYVPHFIALSASSPYLQGVDTGFDSARLNSVFAFPLSGRAPFLLRWSEFNDYFDKMRDAGIVASMKDFYWDIRPKPEFGTIEIRVCDTPLTIERAAVLAIYAQVLARHLIIDRPFMPSEDLYLTYTYNRFQACRFGFDGLLIDGGTYERRTIREDILSTCDLLASHAEELEASEAMGLIRNWADDRSNDARWMRETFNRTRSLHDLVWQQGTRWRAG